MSAIAEVDPRLSPAVRELTDEVVALRRDFHRHPELLFDLPWTTKRIAAYLGELGLEVKSGIGQSGMVGLLKGGKPGPTVMYRADMDALPLQEETGYEFASENNGVMHACGHDGHVAVALVMAKLLAKEKAALAGTIAFLFQPAEEGGDGAGAMIQDGVLEWMKPAVCFAMHLNNSEPTGTIGVREGGVFAGSNEFDITLHSRGGHGAEPQHAADLIVVASHIVIALQTVVSRSIDPREPAVITVGLLHAGTKSNILPTEARLEGTVRTFDKALALKIRDRIGEVAKGIAATHGADIDYAFEVNYPPTINAAGPTSLVREVATEVVGADRVSRFWTMGSEDMSRFLERVPGCYYNVGSGQEKHDDTFGHHSGRFNPDEKALPLAVELGVRVLKAALANPNPETK